MSQNIHDSCWKHAYASVLCLSPLSSVQGQALATLCENSETIRCVCFFSWRFVWSEIFFLAFLVIVSIIFFCRKSEPLQALKLLPSSTDDTNRKSIRVISSSRILQNKYTDMNGFIFKKQGTYSLQAFIKGFVCFLFFALVFLISGYSLAPY